MKERPILFNAEMVRAVLDGRKTQTRRVLKIPNGWAIDKLGQITSPHPKRGKFGMFIKREIHPGCGKHEIDIIPCPYGKLGDELWVRETILRPTTSVQLPTGCSYSLPIHSYFFVAGVTVSSTLPPMRQSGEYKTCNYGGEVEYVADGAHPGFRDDESYYAKKIPSIHTYRNESRIQLRITDVRVERVQGISEDDARAEGVTLPDCFGQPQPAYNYVIGFEKLWDSINGKNPKKCWNANPWVWVVEFERIDR